MPRSELPDWIRTYPPPAGWTNVFALVPSNQHLYGTETLSLNAQQTLVNNGIIGLGSALSVLTFLTVMLVSFIYIRFVGGNIRALAED